VIFEQIKELNAITKGKNVACLDKTCQNNISDSSSKEDEDDVKSDNSDATLNTYKKTLRIHRS